MNLKAITSKYYPITDNFKAHTSRKPPSEHPGIDLAHPMFTMLKSPIDCIVDAVGNDGGKFIRLRSGLVQYEFVHLSRFNRKKGDEVKAGTLIGYSGMSGNATGPHTHFAKIVGGKYIDPEPDYILMFKKKDMTEEEFWNARLYQYLDQYRPAVTEHYKKNVWQWFLDNGYQELKDALKRLGRGDVLKIISTPEAGRKWLLNSGAKEYGNVYSYEVK